jgi:hypothetical protein
MPYPEAFQAAVQLMKLQLHRLGLQYATARIWSFPGWGEVRREVLCNQSYRAGTGLSPCGGVVYSEPQ